MSEECPFCKTQHDVSMHVTWQNQLTMNRGGQEAAAAGLAD